jgi:hypothetical protein
VVELVPITVDMLREIIEPIRDTRRDNMPEEPELSVLAANLTGLQYCNTLAPLTQWHSRDYVKDWRDIAFDIVAAFRKAMAKANPGREYGNGGKIVIDFVYAVSPLILPPRPWSRSAVKQWLVQPYTRKRRRPLAPRRQTISR